MTININRSLLKIPALVFSCLFMFNAQAGMLDSTLDQIPTNPDIFSEFITSNYSLSGTTGTFEADGFASEITYVDGSTENIVGNRTFELDAMINTVDDTATGLLTISGEINSLGFNSGTLLIATLAQIGGPGMTLNFLFNIDGGEAAGLYGGIGATIGVIMNGTGYNSISSFDMASFSSSGANANSDTFAVAVPEPNAFSIILLGLVALGLRKKIHG